MCERRAAGPDVEILRECRGVPDGLPEVSSLAGSGPHRKGRERTALRRGHSPVRRSDNRRSASRENADRHAKLETEVFQIAFVEIAAAVVDPHGQRHTEGRFQHQIAIMVAIQVAGAQAVCGRKNQERKHRRFCGVQLKI